MSKKISTVVGIVVILFFATASFFAVYFWCEDIETLNDDSSLALMNSFSSIKKIVPEERVADDFHFNFPECPIDN